MPTAKPWTFTQLGGKQDTMTLNGWSAPFGRPRHGTIVNAGVKIRRQVTYYADPQAEPTVHTFGKMGQPWELRGRWMDAALLRANGAQDYARQWKDFVEDQQVVRAVWGRILSYRVFIHELDLNFEGEADIVWVMRADVLTDEGSQVLVVDVPLKAPFQLASDILDASKSVVAITKSNLSLSSLLGVLNDISDTIDNLVSLVITPIAVIYDTSQAITDFETAVSSDLVKLLSSLSEARTAVLNLRDVNDNLMSGAALLNIPSADLPLGMFPAYQTTNLAVLKAQADAQTANLLALIADMQNQIDVVKRGQSRSAYQAQDGDTFESIGTKTLGGPDAARAIRQLNGVRYGEKPIPGKVYQIPRGS